MSYCTRPIKMSLLDDKNKCLRTVYEQTNRQTDKKQRRIKDYWINALLIVKFTRCYSIAGLN